MGDAASKSAVPLTELAWGDQAAFQRRHAEMERIYMDVVHHVEAYALRTTRRIELIERELDHKARNVAAGGTRARRGGWHSRVRG
jgi:hypothetical protein